MVKVWFYDKKTLGVSNFGDILTPHILNYYNIDWVSASKQEADIFMTGSIIKQVTSKATVYGSGVMFKTDRIEPSATYKWVRGPITRECILKSGGSCPEVYGDPALVLPKMIDTDITKVGKVGYTPHFLDYSRYSNKFDNVINLDNDNPIEVAKKIASYEKIISSSLHGIIAAHALGIPAAWVPSKNVKGDDSKFYDHYLSVELEPIKSTIDSPIYQVPNTIMISHIENLLKELSL